jgi:hypothetical protein
MEDQAEEINQRAEEPQKTAEEIAEEAKQGHIAPNASHNAEVHSDNTQTSDDKVENDENAAEAKDDQKTEGKNIEEDKVADSDEKAESKQNEEKKIAPNEQSEGRIEDQNKDEFFSITNVNSQNLEIKKSDAPKPLETQTGSDINDNEEVNIMLEDDKEAEVASSSIQKKIAGYKYELLDMLFSFIVNKDKNEEVNPVLSGYFQKIVIALLGYKQKEVMYYIYTKDNIMETLLDHVYDKSI